MVNEVEIVGVFLGLETEIHNEDGGWWIRSLGANGVRQYSLVKEHGWFGNPVLQVKEPLSIDNRYAPAGTVCNVMVFDWRLCQNSLCHNTPTKKRASQRSHGFWREVCRSSMILAWRFA